MFIGNAIPGEAELRPSAIKGALRFWWRAIQNSSDIAKLREEEAKIFGSADEKVGGRSKVQIEVENECITTDNPFSSCNLNRQIKKNTPGEMSIQMNVLEYLAFGAVVKQGPNMIYRYYFEPDSTKIFKVLFSYPEGFDIQSLKDAFLCCSIFGGLGACSRNGFGRFLIKGVENDEETIKRLLKNSAGLKSYTSLSSALKLFALTNAYNKWEDVLCELGKKYFTARVNYQANRNVASKNTFGIDNERNYKNRPYIGSPLMAGNRQEALKIENPDYSLKLERHSKSHFFGIRKENGNYYGYILHLPYDYLKDFPSISRRTDYKNAYDNAANAFNNSLSMPTKQNMKTIIL